MSAVSGQAPAFSAVGRAPRSDRPELVAQLHQDLVAAGFSVDAVSDFVGDTAMAAWHRDEAVPVRRVLHARGSEALALTTLIALFLLGDPVPASAVDAALPTVGSGGLLSLALLEAAPAEQDPALSSAPGTARGDDTDALVRATMDLRPYASDSTDELFVASDLGAFQRPGALRPDYVLGIGGASTTLVQITERRPVERALDVGTGCGIQTFHLLAHADHVTATDLSERALATTRFNLVLNAAALGLDPQYLEERVSLVHGSLLEPVAGRQFDMVVSNPPFVITPRPADEDESGRYTYRDGGMPGDRLVAHLFSTLHTVMAPGATAHMLANWEIPHDPQEEPERTWSRRVRTWPAPQLGAWVIQRELQDPCEYAETWLRDASQQRDRAAYERAYEAYLEDFASRDVAAVGFGYVRLQRTADGSDLPDATDAAGTTGPLRIFEHVPHPVQQPLAPVLREQWQRMEEIRAAERAASCWEDEPWLDGHYAVAPDVTEERHGPPGAEDPALILLRQGAGLRRSVLLTSEAAGFAGACDGELSARQILTALGVLLGWEHGPGHQLLGDIKRLIEHGFLREVSDWAHE